MFIGHFGLAFGAKKAAPAVSLGALFAACQFADLLWPTLVLLGYERVDDPAGRDGVHAAELRQLPVLAQPAGAVRVGRRVRRRSTRRSGARRVSAFVTIALLVVSHWLLDYVTHRPGYAADAGRLRRGSASDLWNSMPGTLAVELAIFAAGLALYLRATSAARSDRLDRSVGAGRLSCSSSILRARSARRRRPPPRSPGRRRRCGCSCIWAYWVDNHRRRGRAWESEDPRVDAYIARRRLRAADPHEIRDMVHASCPDVEEAMKWSFPHFMYKGMLCSMAAFKQHAAFGFWKGSLVTGGPQQRRRDGALRPHHEASDLPSKKVLAGYIKKAALLNEQGVKVPRAPRKAAPKAIDGPGRSRGGAQEEQEGAGAVSMR